MARQGKVFVSIRACLISVWQGTVRRGEARRGVVRQRKARFCVHWAYLIKVWLGAVWRGKEGRRKVWFGKAGKGEDRHGKVFVSEKAFIQGLDWRGVDRRGEAGYGEA